MWALLSLRTPRPPGRSTLARSPAPSPALRSAPLPSHSLSSLMDAPTKRRQQPGGTHPTRRKVVEEPFHPAPPTPATAAAASPSRLVGAVVEKGFSAAAPSSAPRPSVLPFPVARHRSHGPHWGPAAKDATKNGAVDDDDEMDMDETDYHLVAADAAGPVRRKEKKGMYFSRWREFVGESS